MYDPQIGRWIQADPYDEFASGYVGMGDDSINSIDPDGGWSSGFTGALIGAIAGSTAAYFILENNPNMDWEFKALIGVALPIFGAGFGYASEEWLFTDWADRSYFFDYFIAFYTGFNPKMAGQSINSSFRGIKGNMLTDVPKIWGEFNLSFNFSIVNWVPDQKPGKELISTFISQDQRNKLQHEEVSIFWFIVSNFISSRICGWYYKKVC